MVSTEIQLRYVYNKPVNIHFIIFWKATKQYRGISKILIFSSTVRYDKIYRYQDNVSIFRCIKAGNRYRCNTEATPMCTFDDVVKISQCWENMNESNNMPAVRVIARVTTTSARGHNH